MSDLYPSEVGVMCDGPEDCENGFRGDFLVDDRSSRADRFGAALDEAAARGWLVLGRHSPETALAYCPEHRSAAPAVPLVEGEQP